MSEATVLIKSVELQERISQKTGKPYKRVVLTDGNDNWASTFDKAMYEKAKPFEGQQAIIVTEPNGEFTDLIDVKPAAKDPKQDLGTGNYVTGQKPPIEARRIFCGTAAHCATQLTKVLIAHQTAQEITPNLVLATWDAMNQHIFNDLIRRGDAYLEDKDISF